MINIYNQNFSQENIEKNLLNLEIFLRFVGFNLSQNTVTNLTLQKQLCSNIIEHIYELFNCCVNDSSLSQIRKIFTVSLFYFLILIINYNYNYNILFNYYVYSTG